MRRLIFACPPSQYGSGGWVIVRLVQEMEAGTFTIFRSKNSTVRWRVWNPSKTHLEKWGGSKGEHRRESIEGKWRASKGSASKGSASKGEHLGEVESIEGRASKGEHLGEVESIEGKWIEGPWIEEHRREVNSTLKRAVD